MTYPSKWNGGGSETSCGGGSTAEKSRNFRQILQLVIQSYNIKSITDLGCGDGNIYKNFYFFDVDYLGYDIIERKENPLPTEVLDIVHDPYRKSDLFICRDVMIHLPNCMCRNILESAARFGRYLLASTFHCSSNENRITEPSFGYSEINLSIDPFCLGEPLLIINEHYNNKYIGFWKL
jgi:hypothetical protein